MRTCYIGHDAEYRKRKAAGHTGWDTEDGVQETIRDLKRMIAGAAPASGTLLEMGCGAGDQSLWLAAQGYTVTGVDIAPSAIAWAREKAQERGLTADFRVGDVRDLAELPDAAFDVVLDGHCLHCIIGEDRPKFFAAARRVLKPGGFLHIATMCGDPVDGNADFDPATRCAVHGEIATRHYGIAADITQEVLDAGFEITSLQERLSTTADDQHMLFISATAPL